MSDADESVPLDDAAVPSHGTLFDDPESSPPVVSPRLANADRGRLYRSAHAEGPLADAAIMALPRPSEVDPQLPQSPEVLAAEQAAAAAAQREADERARAADEAARAAQAAALAAAEAAALAERARAEAIPPATTASAESPSVAPPAATPVAPAPSSEPPVTPPTAGPVTDAAVAAALGLLPPPGTPPATPAVATPASAPAAAVPIVTATTAAVADVASTAAPAEATMTPAAVLPTGRGPIRQLTWTQSAVLITGVTVVFGLIDVVMRHSIGTLTGIGLGLSTIAAALLVQREDIWVAVVVPPLAFLAALVTSGQLAVGGTGSFISRQALNIVTGLSINAPWILGATAIGLVIVLVRRRRSRPATAVDEAIETPADSMA